MSKLADLITELCLDGVEYKKLSEITLLTAGDRITKSMMRDDFEYPVMSSGAQSSGNYNDYNYSHSVAIPRVGAAGLVNWIENKFWATDDCFVCSQKSDEVDIKYIYYFLKTKQSVLQSKIYGGTFPKLKKDYLWSLPIPIPPREIQNKIVTTLDHFDKLCNDLAQGLPAEINARRKQYEYYRDTLLTFKQKKTTK